MVPCWQLSNSFTQFSKPVISFKNSSTASTWLSSSIKFRNNLRNNAFCCQLEGNLNSATLFWYSRETLNSTRFNSGKVDATIACCIVINCSTCLLWLLMLSQWLNVRCTSTGTKVKACCRLCGSSPEGYVILIQSSCFRRARAREKVVVFPRYWNF